MKRQGDEWVIGPDRVCIKTESEKIISFLSSISIPTVVVFVAIYIARVFEAAKIGFPISWVQVTPTDLFLILPFVSGSAFILVLLVPFLASRRIGFQGGAFVAVAKWSLYFLGLAVLTVAFFLGVVVVLWRINLMPTEWGLSFHFIAVFGLSVVFVSSVFCAARRIASDLPSGLDDACCESVKDRFFGIAITMIGIDLLVLGAALCVRVFSNVSALVSVMFVSLLLLGLFCVCFVISIGLGAVRDVVRLLYSNVQVRTFPRKKRTAIAIGTLSATLIFCASAGWAGMTDPYEIQSIDVEDQQVYRVVAEYSGGNCVVVPLNESKGEWVEEEGSFVALNCFNGYVTVETVD